MKSKEEIAAENKSKRELKAYLKRFPVANGKDVLKEKIALQEEEYNVHVDEEAERILLRDEVKVIVHHNKEKK